MNKEFRKIFKKEPAQLKRKKLNMCSCRNTTIKEPSIMEMMMIQVNLYIYLYI